MLIRKKPDGLSTDNLHSFQRVLVTMTDPHLGNLVVALPVMQQVAADAEKQGVSIRFLIDQPFCELLGRLLGEERIIPYPRKELNDGPAASKIRAARRLISSVRRFQPEMAVDLYDTAQPSAVIGVSGAGVRVGPEKNRWFCRFLTERVKPEGRPNHRIGGYHYIAAAAGLCGDLYDQRPACDEAILKKVKEGLKEIGRDDSKPLALLHPGAGKEKKIWPQERFAMVADQLSTEGYQVAVIGAGADTPLCEKIVNLSNSPVINLCNRFSIMELYHLFFLADFLLGNDSGPTHLAALTPIRIYSIFGPTDPVYWKPLSDNCSVITQKPVQPVSPDHEAKHRTSIKDIKVEHVMDALSPAA